MTIESKKFVAEGYRTSVSISGTSATSHYSPSTTYSVNRVIQKLPNYRQLIDKHQDATLPYSSSGVGNIRYTPSFFAFTAPKVPYVGQGYQYFAQQGTSNALALSDTSHLTIPTSIKNSLIGEVNEKMYRKYMNVVANPQTLPFLAESKELLTLHKHVGLSMTELFVSMLGLIKGDFRKRNLTRLISSLQDLWLTWSFSISPTISDVHEIGQALAESQNKNHLVKVMTSREYELMGAISSPSFMDYSAVTNWVTPKCTGQKKTKWRYGMVGAFELNTQSSALNYANNLNLLPEDFIPTIWELIPFSWVVDYFTNASDFINSKVIMQPSWVYLNSSELTKTEVEKTLHLSRSSSLISIYSDAGLKPGNVKYDYYTFTRANVTKIGLQPVSFHMKDVTQISDHWVPKLLNLASLLKVK